MTRRCRVVSSHQSALFSDSQLYWDNIWSINFLFIFIQNLLQTYEITKINWKWEYISLYIFFWSIIIIIHKLFLNITFFSNFNTFYFVKHTLINLYYYNILNLFVLLQTFVYKNFKLKFICSFILLIFYYWTRNIIFDRHCRFFFV